MAGNILRTATNEIVTTEWEDIQYKYGNKVGKYATQEEEILRQKEIRDVIEEALDNYDPLEHRTAEQLDEMLEEDGRGDEDEDVLIAYRQKRKQEMMEKQRGSRFGSVKHITKPQYVEEVTNAGEGIWVLVLLLEEGHDGCAVLRRLMEEVAERNPLLKVVSIKSTDAIANFPSHHLPTVLVYRSGQMSRQLNGLKEWGTGSANPTLDSVVERLRRLGPLRGERLDADSDEDEADDDDEREARTAGVGRTTGGRSKFSLMR